MSTHDAMEQKPDRVSLADEEGVKQVLVNSILGLWDVVNNLTRLQPSRCDRYRVTIARLQKPRWSVAFPGECTSTSVEMH